MTPDPRSRDVQSLWVNGRLETIVPIPCCIPVTPTILAELAALMGQGSPLHLIAGGTDTLVAGLALPKAGRLVDLTALPALRGIDCTGAEIVSVRADRSAA